MVTVLDQVVVPQKVGHAELFGAMRDVEIVVEKGWAYLWLDSDSKLVHITFINRWFSCIFMTPSMSFSMGDSNGEFQINIF